MHATSPLNSDNMLLVVAMTNCVISPLKEVYFFRKYIHVFIQCYFELLGNENTKKRFTQTYVFLVCMHLKCEVTVASYTL